MNHYLKIFIGIVTRELLLLHAFILDFVRFTCHSRTITSNNRAKLLSEIISNYHVLEKGISMPNRKPVFGMTTATNLIRLLHKWFKLHYKTNVHIVTATHVLHQYLTISNVTDDLRDSIIDFFKKVSFEYYSDNITTFGGYKNVSKIDFYSQIKGDFKDIAYARNSFRTFTGSIIDKNVILKSIKLAQQTPSACNRQPWKVYWTNKPAIIQSIIQYQTGNRGFGDKLGALLIVTSDLNSFYSHKEINQPYVDGGLFSMSLIFSLTYYGVGTCSLNWCASHQSDRAVHLMCSIPHNHRIVMMIGAGELKDSFLTPFSMRSKLEDVSCELK